MIRHYRFSLQEFVCFARKCTRLGAGVTTCVDHLHIRRNIMTKQRRGASFAELDTVDSPETEQSATQAMVDALYPQLKRIARDLRLQYSAGETMRATALVSECFLKLPHVDGFADEVHFLRTAARAMRQNLANHARARLTAKRGGGAAMAGFQKVLRRIDRGHDFQRGGQGFGIIGTAAGKEIGAGIDRKRQRLIHGGIDLAPSACLDHIPKPQILGLRYARGV